MSLPDQLLEFLSEQSGSANTDLNWPALSLEACGKAGVFRWFCAADFQGDSPGNREVMAGYVDLASACLTTAFIITQQAAAMSRIDRSHNIGLKKSILADIALGRKSATVGISHLTTSRQHAAKPAVRADFVDSGFVLNGYSPWVTAAPYADYIVVGATLADNRQILAVVPRDSPGVRPGSPPRMLALTGSATAEVTLKEVFVADRLVIAGPVENVMSDGLPGGGRTGGLPTSALALGLAKSAINWMEQESAARPAIVPSLDSLRRRWIDAERKLLLSADGDSSVDTVRLREDANMIALNATQAAMVAAKGAGFVFGHPVERWSRQANFFLVWSCPQDVQNSHLSTLGGCS